MAANEIHWKALTIEWDSARFTLTVPHDTLRWPATWLDHNLQPRVRELLDDVYVAVDAAVADEDGGIYAQGDITIKGIELPLFQFGGAQRLRQIVSEAADAADVAARRAVEHADALYTELQSR